MNSFSITSGQLYIIGLVASALIYAFSFWASQKKVKINRVTVTLAIFVVSLGLAALWMPIILPVFPLASAFPNHPELYSAALAEYFNQLIAVGTMLLGAATIIYNTLGKAVFDKLNPMITDAPVEQITAPEG